MSVAMYVAGRAAGLREAHIRMLERAVRHPEGLLTPPGDSDATTQNRLARELIALGHAEIADGVSCRDEDVWCLDDGLHLLRATESGLEAIGKGVPEIPVPSVPTTPVHSTPAPVPQAVETMPAPVAGRKASKTKGPSRKGRKPETIRSDARGEATARVLDLLRRPAGASLDEIAVDVGWQRHTVRGFLSQLRKRGMAIASEIDTSSSRRRPPRRYRLAG
jgi:hypothetical protein